MNMMNDAVPSPCKRECELKKDICTGCGRTLEEITYWRHLSDKQKKAVLDRLKQAQL